MNSLYLLRLKIISLIRRSGLMPLVNALNNCRLRIVEKYCAVFNKNHLEYLYNDKFFDNDFHDISLKNTPETMAHVIRKFYNPKSVVDFGCGIGIYLRELEKLGVEVLGIDGSPAASRNLTINKNKFLIQDLTKEFKLSKKYDCALCFEVAEHIPTETSKTLVSNLVDASDLILFTAAHKGQGGHYHINEQSPQFWINLFKKKDYQFLEEDTQKIRKLLKDQGAIFWLWENLLIFRK